MWYRNIAHALSKIKAKIKTSSFPVDAYAYFTYVWKNSILLIYIHSKVHLGGRKK